MSGGIVCIQTHLRFEYGLTTDYGLVSDIDYLAYFHKHNLTGLSPENNIPLSFQTDKISWETVTYSSDYSLLQTRNQSQVDSTINARKSRRVFLEKRITLQLQETMPIMGLSIIRGVTLSYASSQLWCRRYIIPARGTWTSDFMNSFWSHRDWHCAYNNQELSGWNSNNQKHKPIRLYGWVWNISWCK